MTQTKSAKVAIVYPGDYQARQQATPQNNRLATVFSALADRGINAVPAVYHDDFAGEVLSQLLAVDAVLVWMNPIQDGRDRSVLNLVLRRVSDSGVFVSAHPDTILKMGTKEVLYRTREMEWGSETHVYATKEEMQSGLPLSLAKGEPRVLKQFRGNGGLGVWKVELDDKTDQPGLQTMLRVRHAKKGSVEEKVSLAQLLALCEPYFKGEDGMIDQVFQPRLVEGMIRCYLVQGAAAGFGLQEINALLPASPGGPAALAPQPGPRLYHPPDLPSCQILRQKVENEWVPAMQQLLKIGNASLPILWDCDFLLGPKDHSGQDTYVLCEINASSVAPYPESAPPYVARAMGQILRQRRGAVP